MAKDDQSGMNMSDEEMRRDTGMGSRGDRSEERDQGQGMQSGSDERERFQESGQQEEPSESDDFDNI
jgi:hypothetical protein